MLTINGAKLASTISGSEFNKIWWITSGLFHKFVKNEVIKTLSISNLSKLLFKLYFFSGFFCSSKTDFSAESFSSNIFLILSFIFVVVSSLSFTTI